MNKHVKLINLKKIKDKRGYFIKLFSNKIIRKYQVEELFITESKKNVFRGFHFQEKKFDVEKLIYCLEGKVLDILIDLDTKKKTFGKVSKINLSDKKNQLLFVPKKTAHGFICLSRKCKLVYFYNKKYNKKFDKGISYDSIKVLKNYKRLIISKRDKSFPTLNDYYLKYK